MKIIWYGFAMGKRRFRRSDQSVLVGNEVPDVFGGYVNSGGETIHFAMRMRLLTVGRLNMAGGIRIS